MHPYLFFYQNVLGMRNRLESSCEPLFGLGIKYFVYQTFSIDGSSFSVGLGANKLHTINLLKYAEQYFNNITHHGSVLTNNVFFEDSNKTHYILLNFDISTFDKKDNHILYLLNEFDIWNSFIIYKIRSKVLIESYCFHMSRSDLTFSQYYINNIKTLEDFCDYFSENIKDIILLKDRFYLAQQFHSNNFSELRQLPFQQLEEFLQKTLLERIRLNGHNIKISRRERECLHYLSWGKSIKEIARTLGLSPRTVEFYLRNLKQKTNLNKGELLRSFIEITLMK